MRFSTEYFLRGARYTTVVYAKNLDQAVEHIKDRKLGETLINELLDAPEMVSKLILQFCWADAIHAACWLGMVATASETCTGQDLLDDQGLIHALSHLVRQSPEAFIHPTDKVCYLILLAYWQALDLEFCVPGFLAYDREPERSMEATRMSLVDQAVRIAYPDWYEKNFQF